MLNKTLDKYPHIISNYKLYKRCKSYPLSLFILNSRWKLFDHILRLDSETPASKAMLYYFENNYAQQYRDRPRTTIVTTLNNDIQRTRNKLPNLPVITLKSLSDPQKLKELAQDKDA